MSLIKASINGSRRFALQTRQMASVVDKAKEKIGKATEKAGEAFTDQGKVGKKFNPDHPQGTAGKTADEAGGPLDKDGSVGHQFTRDGAVGGTVEEAAEKAQSAGKKMKNDAQKP